jgi:hypothetical protein
MSVGESASEWTNFRRYSPRVSGVFIGGKNLILNSFWMSFSGTGAKWAHSAAWQALNEQSGRQKMAIKVMVSTG